MVQNNYDFEIMNEALIKQVLKAQKNNKDINNLSISQATGIHKSTVSNHLNSEKRLSIEHARSYAEYLKVPLIKVIDDTVVKYRVVKYANDLGEITDPTEEDFDVIITPNEIESSNQYCIYDKKRNNIYWYDPKTSCINVNTIDKYCYIKTPKGDYLGNVVTHNTSTIEFFNVHTSKIIKMKFHKCYPLTAITFCDFATATRVKNEL